MCLAAVRAWEHARISGMWYLIRSEIYLKAVVKLACSTCILLGISHMIPDSVPGGHACHGNTKTRLQRRHLKVERRPERHDSTYLSHMKSDVGMITVATHC